MESPIDKASHRIATGAPSGFVVSLLVHAAAFLLAGLLVVFTVVQKQEPKFVPPKAVDRPKMQLKRPQVKPSKSARPRPSNRIVVKSQISTLPDIQLPELGGIGDGLTDGLGGLELMPDMEGVNIYGSNRSIGNDLEGVYYDLKFTRSGVYNPMSDDEWRILFNKFIRNDWNPGIFSKFYRSPNKLYTTCFLLPSTVSAMAPAAFGMPEEMSSGGHWIIHYKGKLVYKEKITFRFWVSADDSLAIRVDKNLVVAASASNPASNGNVRAPKMFGSIWESSSMDSDKYVIGQWYGVVGDWITLEPGVPRDMEVVATDNLHEAAQFIVAVEVQGEEYPRSKYGGPILPIFKTAEITRDHLDEIYRYLPDNEICCTNGPVFRDY